MVLLYVELFIYSNSKEGSFCLYWRSPNHKEIHLNPKVNLSQSLGPFKLIHMLRYKFSLYTGLVLRQLWLHSGFSREPTSANMLAELSHIWL
jgi:hypothetical protein